MIIKNIGTKIINIGTTILMPDQSMKASEAICNTPAIQTFVKLKMLEIVKPVEAPKAPEKEPEKQQEQEQDQDQNQEPDAPAFDAEKAPKKAAKAKK